MSDISYIPLFRTLADKKIKLVDLHKQLDLSFTTLAKLKKNQDVSLSVLKRIMTYLNCNVDAVIDFSPNQYLITRKRLRITIEQPALDDYETTIIIKTPSGEKILVG